MVQIQQLTGPAALERVFQAVLVARPKQLRTALADRPLVYLANDGFAEEFMVERKRRGIHLQSLRFSTDENLDQSHHTNYAKLDKEVRTAPNGLSIQSSLVLWDDNVVSMTTAPEIQAIWIQDAAYAQTINAWFEFIWNLSS